MKKEKKEKIETLGKEGKEEALVFSFGEEEQISRELAIKYFDVSYNGTYYDYPVPQENINQLLFMNTHHSSSIQVKRNIFSMLYLPSLELSRSDITRAIQEYLVFGNAFFEIIKDRGGRMVNLKHMPAMYSYRGKKEDEFYWLDKENATTKKLATGSIIHLKTYDNTQEIYGIPEYLASIMAIKLNNEATLFRRKYYLNGAHMGFILYLNSSHLKPDSIKKIKDQLKKSKGGGNFKNLFLEIPHGKKDDVNLIPVGNLATKDEFMDIKNASRDDVLSAHRVPPNIMGIIPSGVSNFGDVSKANETFYQNEIRPLQETFKEINEILGVKIVDFQEPKFNKAKK